MPSAEIITIGTEILLGEIVDTNARYIARHLRQNGVDIFRTSSIGDNVERIAMAINEARARADVVITTGGLGPTVDDPTREAAARAFGVEVEFRQELWEQVLERYARYNRTPTENNKRQAFVPQGAEAIENLVGTAPAFLMKGKPGVVICLPGVPREMEYLMENEVIPRLRRHFGLAGVLLVRVLHTAGVGESQIDEKIADLEELANPTVGLAAHAGTVDVRIAAKGGTPEEAAARLAGVEADLRERLGSWIYGADDERLADAAGRHLEKLGWRLGVVEAGLGGLLCGELAGMSQFAGGQVLPAPPRDPADLPGIARSWGAFSGADAVLGVSLYPGERKAEIYLALVWQSGEKFLRLPFGGPPKLAAMRAVNNGLDLLRKAEAE
jgi:competence/damage-inducible protein CinA-like protein